MIRHIVSSERRTLPTAAAAAALLLSASCVFVAPTVAAAAAAAHAAFTTTASAMAATPPSFTGSYSAKTEDGLCTLVLSQDASGNVTGTLKEDANEILLKGRVVSEGRVVGTVTIGGAETPIQFEVRRQANTLLFAFLNPENGGQPDPETRITFPAPAASSAGKSRDEEENAPAASGPSRFVGAFKGAEMTVTIKADGAAGLTGAIKMGADSFPLTARAVPQGIEGTFVSGGDTFDFRATLEDGKTLLFDSDGTTHMLVREGGGSAKKAANPLSAKKPKPANPLAKKTDDRGGGTAVASASLSGGGTYRFPVGVGFGYPKGWTVKDLPGGDVQVAPPNAAAAAAEAYVVLCSRLGDSAAGLRGDDPRLTQVVDSIVQKLAPTLHRVGDREAVRAGNEPGSLYTYDGASPTGKPARARIRLTVLNGSLTGVISVGEKDRIMAREKAAQSIFNSFTTGEAAIDQRLVGAWVGGLVDNGKLIPGAGGKIRTTTASDSQTRYVLSPDGTLAQITRSRTIVNSPGISLDTGDQEETKRGRWSAANGRLDITMQNGTTISCTYQVQGSRVMLKYADGSTAIMNRRD